MHLIQFIAFQGELRGRDHRYFLNDAAVRQAEHEKGQVGRAAEGHGLVADLLEVRNVVARTAWQKRNGLNK